MNRKSVLRSIGLAAMMTASTLAASAQEMTKAQWQEELHKSTQQRDELQASVKSLEADVIKLKTESASLAQQIGKCQEDLLTILGTTTAQEKSFAAYLDSIDTMLNDLSKRSDQELLAQHARLDTVQSMIDHAKRQKLAALPENDQRIHEEQFRLDALRDSLKKLMASTGQTYIVRSWASHHDCLWNIAKKPKIYDNAFLWPKIWQDNKDQIRNPDVIHPGERLKIPRKAPMTASEEDAFHLYWHKKLSFASSKHLAVPGKQ